MPVRKLSKQATPEDGLIQVRPQIGAAAPFPSRFEAMLAESEEHAFVRAGWLFEPKLDGMRGLAMLRDGKISLMSRNGLDFSSVYPTLSGDIQSRLKYDCILDGEIVCIDESDCPSFELLQKRIRMRDAREIALADVSNPVYYFLFDILYWRGRDLTGEPLTERKKLLQEVIDASSSQQGLLMPTPTFDEDGVSLFEAVRQRGWEGIMAKRAVSKYQPGRRSRDWIKVKVKHKTTVAIAGHHSDLGFLVGRPDGQGRFAYTGGVPTGLKGHEADFLRQNLKRVEKCPFEANRPRLSAVWFEPTIFARVAFQQWTSNGLLRHPSFKGLLPDVTDFEHNEQD